MRWGQASDLPRYRCKACRRTFNALTKTPLANLRMKDKWAAQTEAMIEGVSIAKAARRCDVHYTTAFRWRHRFLASLAGDKPKTLAGIVEGDETFILESFKGKRSGLPRKSRKRGGKSAKRGLSAEQIPVIVARDREGATTEAVLPRLNRISIAAALDGVVTPANQFCCDGGTAIVAFARRAGIAAHILPMPGKPNPKGAGFSPQQRQCLPRPPERVAAPLPWRRHQKPAELSRLAPHPGSVGPERYIGRHDPRGYRFGALSTNNAIRAKEFDLPAILLGGSV